MANPSPRGSSLFSGLTLVFVGILLLLHNYHGLSIGRVFGHWWPLLIILWGAVKLFERMAAQRSGDPSAARISGGEIFLVLGLLALMGIVVGVEFIKGKVPEGIFDAGDKIGIDLNVEPRSVPSDARISIRIPRGSIAVRPSEEPQIHVGGKKYVKAWSESDADQI